MDQQDKQAKKWSPGKIVGVVIGGVLGLLFLLGIFGGGLVVVLQKLGLMQMTANARQPWPDGNTVHIGPYMP